MRDKDFETPLINTFEVSRGSTFLQNKKPGDQSMRVPLIEEDNEYNYLPKTKVLPTEGEQ